MMVAGQRLAALVGSPRMWRLVFVFAAALVVADSAGLLPEGDDTECSDECAGKQCPPTCATCTCAWHSLRSAPTTLLEMAPIELTSRTVDLPPPDAADGLTAPAPTTRPPIV